MTDTSIVKAERLFKRYGDLTAVDHIDFRIAPGECFGFLGPNGAGKTTTMKMIYCFVLPDGGLLEVDGLNVLKQPREIKQILGVVHQEDSLDPDLTVRENLIVYGRYFDIPPRVSDPRADELIEMMSLTDKQDTVIEELSGGMKRRLMIIRGLINAPKILILDEPTTGLDPQARHLVWEKLRSLKKSGITILLTTHYMEEAAQLCDRLIMMHSGKIIGEGSPAELIGKYAGGQVIEIIDTDEAILELLKSVVTGNDYFENYGDKAYIYTDDTERLNAALQRHKIATYMTRPSNLEDVFLRLTGRSLIN